MGTFEELGTGIFIIVMVMNFFLIAFAGFEGPKTYTNFVPDGNITSGTVLNPDYAVGEQGYSTPTQTQFNNNNDPIAFTINLIFQNGYSILLTALFGITIFAIQAGAPQAILIAFIAPLNIIFLFYLTSYASSLLGLRRT